MRWWIAIFVACALVGRAVAQSDTAFSFQGRLIDQGEPATGSFDLDFALYDAAIGGTQVGSTVSMPGHPANDGFFAATLDFGGEQFDGDPRWIELHVNGQLLAPRQEVGRVPYAIQTRGLFVTDSGRVAIGGTDTPARLTVGFPVGAPGAGRFLVVGRPTGQNIEVNEDFIQAFTSGSIPSRLFLNPDGGEVVMHGSPPRVGIGTFRLAIPLAVAAGTDASPGGGGFMMIGNSPTSTNLLLDDNEIMARNNGAVAPIAINHNGGHVHILGAASNSYGVAIGTTSPLYNLHVNGTAGKPGGGSWSNSSDRRLKKNIEPMRSALEDLLALRGVKFSYIDPEAINELPGERIGMIAQEVEAVFPEWVDERTDGFKVVTYRGFEAITVEALRELRAEKDRQFRLQQDRIEGLEIENDRLRRRLDALEAVVNEIASNTEDQSP